MSSKPHKRPTSLARPLWRRITREPVRQFVTLVVQCDFAHAHAGDSVFQGEQLIGSVTTGAYVHRLQKNIAFAFFSQEHGVPGTELAVEFLGQMQAAQVAESCLYDPTNRG